MLHEDRDGKIVADFYTQKPAGEEDIEITAPDIMVRRFMDEPIYERIATRVVSYGQAILQELPNLCLGKDVTNLWPYDWKNLADVQDITDGDPATGGTAGYGRWDEGTFTVVQALQAAAETGIPCVSIDMGEDFTVETIIVARPSQQANEGDKGGIQSFSTWISQNGSAWTKLVGTTQIPPGQNVQFKAGTNYPSGTKFRHIRINLHSLGLYAWEGHTDSQMGFSEVQCYESEQIRGEATLQDEDSTLPHYDEWGLLKKYGIIVHIARGGQPDPALNSEAKADADAGDVLDEIVRLMVKTVIDTIYLPGVPIFSTIKIHSPTLRKTESVFVESRTLSLSGDTFVGDNLP